MTELTRRDFLHASAALTMSPVWLQLLDPVAAVGAEPYADARLVSGEPPLPAEGSFTVVVLPDTQNYSEKHPDIYLAQTKWIVENQSARKIAAVLHLGDITNHSTAAEWEVAVEAMGALDGKLPYFMVPGNHDYSEGGSCKDRTSRMSEYFPVKKLQEQATFGGVYDKEPERVENSYHLFEAHGRKFLVLGLEFGPRQDVVRWANEVVAQHKDREAILITHAYMYFDDTRYNWQKYGAEQKWNPHGYGVAKATENDVCDGEELWDKLISRHENFILTFNGHVLGDGLGRMTSTTAGERDVHQILVNYQMRPNGGDGWLRLLEFRADGKTLAIYDYSPTRGERNESEQNQFELTLAAVK
jgi:predicted phosphodiesterase